MNSTTNTIIDDKMTKICKKCKKNKDESEFSRNGKFLRSKCKTCTSLDYKKYDYKDKQAIYREENKEKISQYHKEYYISNKEDLINTSKQYYLKNKETICKRTKEYREINKTWYKEYKKCGEIYHIIN